MERPIYDLDMLEEERMRFKQEIADCRAIIDDRLEKIQEYTVHIAEARALLAFHGVSPEPAYAQATCPECGDKDVQYNADKRSGDIGCTECGAHWDVRETLEVA